MVKKDNVVEKYTGVVSKIEASYGFIIRDVYQDRVFTHCLYNQENEWRKLKPQRRVSFNLAFNNRGPFALDVRIEEKPL